MYRIVIAAFWLFSTIVCAQNSQPLPQDLARLPSLGVERADATKFLENLIQFSERKEENRLTHLEGQIEGGQIRVAFKLADKTVIAGLIAIPDSSRKELAILKNGMLIRFMMNLIPEVNWNDAKQSELLGEAIAIVSKGSSPGLTKTFGEKFVFVLRDPRDDGLINCLVMNTRVSTGRFDIGKF